MIGESNIVSGSLIPQEAGTEMKVVIDGYTLELETLMVFLAIKAFDAANHASDLSNIVAVTLELGSLHWFYLFNYNVYLKIKIKWIT